MNGGMNERGNNRERDGGERLIGRVLNVEEASNRGPGGLADEAGG